MPRYDDDDEDEDDDDYGDDGGDDAETVPCATAGRTCTRTRSSVRGAGSTCRGRTPPTRPRRWVAVVMVLALAAAVMWVFG